MSKEEKKPNGAVTIWTGIALVLLATLLLLFGWNIGLVPAILALGGHVTTINIWCAWGLVVLIRTVGGLL